MEITLRSGKELNRDPSKATKEVDADMVTEQAMPKYAKYLRDIVTNKVKLHDIETVALTEKCSAVMTQKMPKKLKDTGKFTLLIQIKNSKVVHTLSDLGASVNLMPLSLFNTLNLGKPRPSSILLQLANGTIAHSERVIEDVLIKVGKFTILANLKVLDFQADE
ncbi:uncharacterized protein LOC107879116 [Capsicum annuum]|uniref:uncharacterized protein LOC107879116 n=1 Tax=Capsicum annuum TaxID=4072 RepID=UPI0007BFC695|nr:uncharacterized protein LOC107879116 [Capsicum annuum]